MFKTGEKVVCVDDQFSDGIKKFYWKLPVKGVVYTVRDVVPGITSAADIGKRETPTVYLVELINPCSDKPPYPERGFKCERFAPLQTDEDEVSEVDDAFSERELVTVK